MKTLRDDAIKLALTERAGANGWPMGPTRSRALTIVDVFSRKAPTMEVGKRLRARGRRVSAESVGHSAPRTRVHVRPPRPGALPSLAHPTATELCDQFGSESHVDIIGIRSDSTDRCVRLVCRVCGTGLRLSCLHRLPSAPR